MNIFDIIILAFIILGFFVGFKRGLTNQIVSTVGIILIVVVAFIIKNPIAEFLYTNLPFFDFGGAFKGLSVLNIAVYEIIAFLFPLTILAIVFELLLYGTRIFEKLLKWTIVLGFPSKILGGIIGLIENYIITFIVLYILALPTLNINFDSKVNETILNRTPVLNNVIDDTISVFDEFGKLKEKYEKDTNPNQFNKETLDLFLKYKITTVKSVDTLVKKGKIKIDGIDEVLDKYREE